MTNLSEFNLKLSFYNIIGIHICYTIVLDFFKQLIEICFFYNFYVDIFEMFITIFILWNNICVIYVINTYYYYR